MRDASSNNSNSHKINRSQFSVCTSWCATTIRYARSSRPSSFRYFVCVGHLVRTHTYGKGDQEFCDVRNPQNIGNHGSFYAWRPNLPANKNTRRSFTPRNHGAKPRLDQELIDDQKFQQKLDAKRFTAVIEREADEAILCPSCASSDWRMQPKYLANLGSSCSGLDFPPS